MLRRYLPRFEKRRLEHRKFENKFQEEKPASVDMGYVRACLTRPWKERRSAKLWIVGLPSVFHRLILEGSFFGAGSLFDASTASGLFTRLSQQHSLIQQSQYMPRLIELRRCCTNRLFGRHPRPFLAVGVFGVIDVVLIAANSIVDLRDR